MKVCIYSRVSTGEQDTNNQSAVLADWAGQRGFEVVKVYEEEESAWKAGHQRVLANLITDARRRGFQAVLVWALDRLSREGALAILSLVHSLSTCGVRVLSYQESWTEAPGELLSILASVRGEVKTAFMQDYGSRDGTLVFHVLWKMLLAIASRLKEAMDRPTTVWEFCESPIDDIESKVVLEWLFRRR